MRTERARAHLHNEMPELMGVSEEDLQLIVNAAFAEAFAGYKREHNGETYVWRDTGKPDSRLLPIERLPSVAVSAYALLSYLHVFCDTLNKAAEADDPDAHPTVWQLMMKREDGRNVYRCQIARLVAKKQAEPLKTIDSNYAGMAVALAMLCVTNTDLASLHRELMPHRYILS